MAQSMRMLVAIAFLLLTTTTLLAKPDFKAGTRYHIVCLQFPEGCVADGATAGQPTPLYYLQQASSEGSAYWYFDDAGDDYFYIRNVATNSYITYDGVRLDIATSGELRRYVSMTATPDGSNSMWYIAQQGDGVYTIRNAQQSDHIWDVRVDSYCVGTYSNSGRGNGNQQFAFYDADGQQVGEQQEPPTPPTPPVDEDGTDVSTWLVATAEASAGWQYTGTEWTDPGFGNYVNGEAAVVSPFRERWHETYYGGLPDATMQQTLQNLPAGTYTLQADIIAVKQRSNGWFGQQEEVGYNVFLFANSSRTEAGTSNEKPIRYTTDVTIGKEGQITLGVSIESTNANWVAVDNFVLRYHGTEQQLIEGEKAKVRTEIADYYPSDEIETLIANCNDDFEALEQLRKSIESMPAIDPLSHFISSLTIDNRAPVYVKSLDLYLCTLPETEFGKSYTARIDFTPRQEGTTVRISGSRCTPGQDHMFSTVTANKTYTVAVTDANRNTRQCEMTFTALPVVRLYGTFDNNYSDGLIDVNEPDKAAPAMLHMKAKWRGGITNSNGKNKRNYHVKLKDENGEKLEQKFFGLRNDNSWILEACQVDMSRIRNRVLTDLWNDYSTPPYYISQEPKAKTGTRGQFVELILNDEYRGIYCMTENMDRKQLKLKKRDDVEGITHGQLWKSKDWSYAVFMGPNRGHYQPADYLTNPNYNSDMWDRYQVKYPDFEDYGYETDWSTLYNAVDFVCHSSDEEFTQHFNEHFDLPLIIDYYILMESILATDNHGKNLFFAVYDKQEDQRITLGVWDMDATCGQRWSDAYYHWDGMRPEQDYATYIYNQEHGKYNLFERLKNTDTDNFNMRVRLRYRELRENHLATENILQRFRTYLDMFKLCGADQREYNRWNGNSDIAGLTLDFDNEMDYLDDWFTRRMNYLDTERFDIASLPSDITDIAGLNSTLKHQAAVYNINGVKVGTTESFNQLPSGIYVVNGRKIVK